MDAKQALDQYIRALLAREGSDIHVCVGSQILFRAHRSLQVFLQSTKVTEQEALDLLQAMNPQHDTNELYKKKHVMFRYKHTLDSAQGQVASFRVTAFIERGLVSISMRLLKPPEFSLDQLNLPLVLQNVCTRPQGLFLVVGPSGHGKSTTLAAMIEYINQSHKRMILTVEDPIEFLFESKESIILQRQVPTDTNSFQTAIETALRSDLDVIMIGEMRAIETISAVTTLAEVGHLVFSTLHANDAPQMIHRIIDSFPASQQNQIRNQLAHTLLGAMSIRLIPRVGGGLIPACEILFNNPAVANVIREDKVSTIETIIQTSASEGMVSLDQSLANLVREGEVTLESAKASSKNLGSLKRFL